MVLLPCSPCCEEDDCEPLCEYIPADCLAVTFSGWTYNGTAECQQCGNLDGTYILDRDATNLEVTVEVPELIGGGDGAEFNVVLSQSMPEGHWTVDEVVLVSGGSGYAPDTPIFFKILNGQVQCGESGPAATLTVGRGKPELESNPKADISVEQTDPSAADGERKFRIESMVPNEQTGSGHTDGDTVQFTATGATFDIDPTVLVRVTREEPYIEAEVQSSSGGGAFLYPVLTETTDTDGLPAWGVDRVEFLYQGAGGSGYAIGDSLTISRGYQGVEIFAAVAEVSSVGSNGEILSVRVSYPGIYYRTDGSVDSFEIVEPGEFYTGGEILEVTLTEPGKIQPLPACVYKGKACKVCPADYESVFPEVRLGITPLVSGGGLRFTVDEIAQITIPLPAEGLPFEFDPASEDATVSVYRAGCVAGKITVQEAAGCDEPSGPCEGPPEEIQVTIRGTGSWHADGTYILSRTADTGCSYHYFISIPGEPDPSFNEETPFGGIAVEVHIEHRYEATRIVIQGGHVGSDIYFPGEGAQPEGAGAEVTSTDGNGGITAVEINDPGAGYAVEIFEHAEPTITLSIESDTGSGATLTPLLTRVGSSSRDYTWMISGVSVDAPGTGYSAGDSISVDAGDAVDLFGYPPFMQLNVNGDGEIQSVDGFFPDGSYYRSVATGQAEVGSPTVNVLSPAGEGAELVAVVDDDVSSPTFGEIKEIQIANGGQDYSFPNDFFEIFLLASGGTPGLRCYQNPSHPNHINNGLVGLACPAVFTQTRNLSDVYLTAQNAPYPPKEYLQGEPCARTMLEGKTYLLSQFAAPVTTTYYSQEDVDEYISRFTNPLTGLNPGGSIVSIIAEGWQGEIAEATITIPEAE